MRKIYIFGGPGTGKTIFAQILGQSLGIDVIYLDKIMYENGAKRDEKEMYKLLRSEIDKRKEWIVEGACLGWSDFLFEEVDLVIQLTVNPLVALFRILKRHFRRKNSNFSFRSTLRLCFKTLPAYYSKEIMDYPQRQGAKVLRISHFSLIKPKKKGENVQQDHKSNPVIRRT